MAAADAHLEISITCIRYLILCVTNTQAFNFPAASPFSETISSAIRQLFWDNPHLPPMPEVHHNPADLLGAGPESWSLGHFERYARYLNNRPFLAYILGYLNEHLPKCRQAEGIPELVLQLWTQLAYNPMAYLLWNLVATESGKPRAASSEQRQAEDFLSNLVLAATKLRFPRAVEVLLVAGADAGCRLDGKTLLMVSAENGDQATVRVLLRKGVDIEATAKQHQTALHLAAANGHATMVRLLVDQGANKEAGDWGRQTALHVAAMNGYESTVQMLVETLAVDREAKDMFGRTALHFAAQNGHESTVQMLIKTFGVNKEANDCFGQKSLHLAAGKGHGGTIRILIETLGVDRGSKDKRGRTALHLAAAFGKKNMVQILITLLVDKECRDDEGKRALDLARLG
jgi:ankyrin repeat protein